MRSELQSARVAKILAAMTPEEAVALAAVALGRKGGQARSPAKAAASRANGRKGGGGRLRIARHAHREPICARSEPPTRVRGRAPVDRPRIAVRRADVSRVRSCDN